MIDFEDSQKRFVTPKWLPLDKATEGRDLAIPRSRPFVVDAHSREKLLADYLEFQQSPDLLKAGDLMGAALVIGERAIANEVAEYYIEISPAENIGVRFAKHIVLPESKNTFPPKTDTHIVALKRSLINFPKNPLIWTEIARLYTIKGQIDKARRAMIVAVSLAPSHRFVVRSAARFYMHIREFDDAWRCVKKALELNPDPWIEATLINLAMAMERNPRALVRRSLPEISAENGFQYSELMETRGMLELESGNQHRARKIFRQAWIDPSRNVVTHAEWIIRKNLPGMAESASLDFSSSPEAETWRSYWSHHTRDALVSARQWAFEEPYSRHPWIIGSSIASCVERFKEAESFAREGLLANPRDFILNNNLAYALLRDSRITEAEIVLKNIPTAQTANERTVSLATRGLLEFKKGQISVGRQLYLDALSEAEKLNSPRFVALASLNLAIAEVEANGDRATEFILNSIATAKRCDDPDVALTLRQLQLKVEKLLTRGQSMNLKFPHGLLVPPRESRVIKPEKDS